jgi:hypothetical protein
MKKTVCIVLVILVLAFLSVGCGDKTQPQPDTPEPSQESPSEITIIFSNASDYNFNEIYISPTAADEWGEELLGSTRILKSGGSIDVDIPAYDFNNYDILVIDEDRDEYTFTRVPLQNGSEVAIYFGEEGLAADVYDDEGNDAATVYGTLGDAYDGDDAQPDVGADDIAATGSDTDGQYIFTVYNESDYDIYAIHMGTADASAEEDIDILPEVLSAGESTDLSGTAPQELWSNTEWTLYITDTEGDTSTSFDEFNPWIVSYVDIYWDSDNGGYVCEFAY